MSDPLNLADATVIKAGNGFCVAHRDGGLPIDEDHPLGVYVDDCRYLRGHELLLGGHRPRLLIASDAAGTAAVFEFTNPDLELADGRPLPAQSLRLRVERRMDAEAMAERISLRSYARETIELELELRLDADLRPMLEIRGAVSPAAREVRREVSDDALRFAAVGLDGLERSTTVSAAGAAAEEDGRLHALMRLAPGEEATLHVRFAFGQGVDRAAEPVDQDHRRAAREAAAGAEWLIEHTRVEVDDELVDRIMRRALLDLRLLLSELDGKRYFSAGIPWFAALFGRDSIISAMQVLAYDPAIAEETLRLLADRLGSRVDDEHDEEPGKVLHELRLGEVAAQDLTPLARYYGTVDATPLFLCLLCEHANWSGSLNLFRELRPQVEAALRWIDEYGDLDGDRLLEYRTRSSSGLVNQGWKDSWDGIVDEHGELLPAPIALVEVQGYAVAAKRRLARLFELDGDPARAHELRAQAALLTAAVERFWLDDRGFYSMALDADKRPSAALASNQGHLLWALAIPQERARAVEAALMGDGANSGWGVRTLGAREPAFNPVGYHLGTVWPHDNAMIAWGLRRYGFDEAFLRIFEDLIDASASFADYRLPELFAGFARTDYEDPVPYPVACSPQAWAAGALPSMLTAGLGLVPNALERRLCVVRPSLPRHVSRLVLHGLKVADARLDLTFERVSRRSDSVALTEAEIDGDVDVVLHIESGRDQEHAPSLDQVRESAGAAETPAPEKI
jgi:glycogen debranching enzyme